MKKEYSTMDAVVIPIANTMSASDGNCVQITQMETSPGSSKRCDLTDPDFVQNEWYGNNNGLPLTYSVTECY